MQMIDACSRLFELSRRNSDGRFGRSGADSDGEPNMRPRNSIAATTASTEDGDREVRWECSTAMAHNLGTREVDPLLPVGDLGAAVHAVGETPLVPRVSA